MFKPMGTITMKKTLLATLLTLGSLSAAATPLSDQIQQDYQQHLGALFTHFHQHPELSHMETQTAKRLAKELRAAGFEVTEGVGKTGVVAMLKNGPGPLVMMRADMDGLPVEEKSGLPYASKAKQTDWDGNEVHVMHACGHDVHITSLVGTARRMAAMEARRLAARSRARRADPGPFARGSLVWVKLPGFPWWPSQVRSTRANANAS